MYIGNIPEGHAKPSDGSKVKIGFSEQFSKDYTVNKWKPTKSGAIASFKGIISDARAAALLEKGVFIDETALSDDGNEKYFVDNLVGCMVYEFESGILVGEITDVWLMPANDVWLVETKEGMLPVPVIDEVIKNVNIEERKVEIVLIDGLLDLLEPVGGSLQ